MSEKLPNIINEVLNNRLLKNSPSLNVARYLFDNQGANLDQLTNDYIQSGFSQQNLTIFARKYRSIIGELVLKQNDKELVKESNQAIMQIAEERNIRLDKHSLKIQAMNENKYRWIRVKLDLKYLDKTQKTKECLKWIDCLTEFYSGKNIFEKDNNTQFLQKSETFENLQNKINEEYFVRNLIEQGYLQCDLNR